MPEVQLEEQHTASVRPCITCLLVCLVLIVVANLHTPDADASPRQTTQNEPVASSGTSTSGPSALAAVHTLFAQSFHQITGFGGRKSAPVYRVSSAAHARYLAPTNGVLAPEHIQAAARANGYWHTSGRQILDSQNRPVRIAGISWYGFETADAAPHGLTSRDFRSILEAIRANGYNTVRLPFSNGMVQSQMEPRIAFEDATGHPINTSLQGLTSLEVMDRVIAYAGSIGLRVILDNHRSEAGDGPEANGLWYTPAYPESTWIRDWQTLAARYAGNPTVIGVDLRNEPHNASMGGSCWGCGSATHDWRLAAERAGDAILRINPRLLIFVEGTDTVAGDSYWWGGNLEGAAYAPVRLAVAHQLVYSAHDYGPSEYAQPWFNAATTQHSLEAVWTRHWAFLSQRGIAPVWLSEFGTVNDAASIRSSEPGSEGQWFESMVNFLQANPSLSWAYWAVNGDDRYGLLDASFDPHPASPLKQQTLALIEPVGENTGSFEEGSSFATK